MSFIYGAQVAQQFPFQQDLELGLLCIHACFKRLQSKMQAQKLLHMYYILITCWHRRRRPLRQSLQKSLSTGTYEWYLGHSTRNWCKCPGQKLAHKQRNNMLDVLIHCVRTPNGVARVGKGVAGARLPRFQRRPSENTPNSLQQT